MNNLLKILTITFALFALNQVSAQEPENREWSEKANHKEDVVVYLKSGTIFSGAVKYWKIGESITIVTDAGNEFTFKGDTIDKVVQLKLYDQSTKPTYNKIPYNFNERGLYYAVRAHFINGNFGDRANEDFGVGISALLGMRFHRLIGVGVGLGYDSFILETGERVMPIFAEATGYLSPKNTSLSYGLAAGYSLAFNSDDYGITDAKGGLMVHPSIGLRFGVQEHKFTVDLGYRFQKAQFTYQDRWSARSWNTERLLYKRVTLRFGVTL